MWLVVIAVAPPLGVSRRSPPVSSRVTLRRESAAGAASGLQQPAETTPWIVRIGSIEAFEIVRVSMVVSARRGFGGRSNRHTV
jgi:hypothetical protein